MSAGASSSTLLAVESLKVSVSDRNGKSLAIVDGVSFSVGAREVLGIAGESGSGKTIATRALVGLQPAGSRVMGAASFRGVDLLTLTERELRGIRGKEISVISQNPMTALHPMLPVKRQLTEHVRKHLGLSRKEADARALELLDEVRIPDARRAMARYPHEFSGGMRQRIVIAMALACRPRLVIADEPTTALDMTVQAGVLQLLDSLRRDHDMGIILVTHDVGVMSTIADRMVVFYAGRIVEGGDTTDLLDAPQHPYTASLLRALPDTAAEGQHLVPIPGVPATPERRPAGCAFHPRCEYRQTACDTQVPPLVRLAGGRVCACPVAPFKRPGVYENRR